MSDDQQKPAQDLKPRAWPRWTNRIVGGLLLLVLAGVGTIILVIIAITHGLEAEKKEGLQGLEATGQRFEANPQWTEIKREVLWEHDCGQWTSSRDCNTLYQTWDTGSPYRAGLLAEVTGRFNAPLTLDTGPEGQCNQRDAAYQPMHGCRASGAVDGLQVAVGITDTGEATNAVVHLRVEHNR